MPALLHINAVCSGGITQSGSRLQTSSWFQNFRTASWFPSRRLWFCELINEQILRTAVLYAASESESFVSVWTQSRRQEQEKQWQQSFQLVCAFSALLHRGTCIRKTDTEPKGPHVRGASTLLLLRRSTNVFMCPGKSSNNTTACCCCDGGSVDRAEPDSGTELCFHGISKMLSASCSHPSAAHHLVTLKASPSLRFLIEIDPVFKVMPLCTPA